MIEMSVDGKDRFSRLMALREKHGFQSDRDQQGRETTQIPKARNWSKRLLARPPGDLELPQQLSRNEATVGGEWVPKNAPLLDQLVEKLASFGFRWKAHTFIHETRVGTRERHYVKFDNYPTIGGIPPTLFDLAIAPLDMFDGYAVRQELRELYARIGTPAGFKDRREIMSATGIGYKGITGVSWLPACEPFVLPHQLEERLQALGDALFLFFDSVYALYEKNVALRALLQYKVPSRIPQIMEQGEVSLIRPDIVIVRDKDKTLRPVVTELESAPAGQGMLHTMQHGYDLGQTTVKRFVEFLDGRPYIVLATHEWLEYVWEQGLFCAALRKNGVEASIWFDRNAEEIASQARSWRPPKGAPGDVVAAWDTDVHRRLHESSFETFVRCCHPSQFPARVGPAVVFRFGYYDNFSPDMLDLLWRWQKGGATLVNPLQFPLENKALMAAIWLPGVATWISERNPQALEVLRSCVAETRLLSPEFASIDEFLSDRPYWITKYGAWDGANFSWGSRSLVVGAQTPTNEWRRGIENALSLPHPVVAQHAINSAQFSVPYVDKNDRVQVLDEARTRLTPFYLRGKNGTAVHCGSIITLRAKSFRIHGATDAVEAPVIFQ